MSSAKLYALTLLAWAFVLRLFKNLFGRGPRGLSLFRVNYEKERLGSLTETERAELADFGRCIACGRCNIGDGARIVESKGAYPGTMALMLASSRSMPDFHLAAGALLWISEEELAQKETICPTYVPMRRIAAFVRAHGQSSA
jgi:hypothetical protein